MFNMLSLLVIFNLSKIKKILPKKNIKYKALVLTKSVGIDDLIISQKKYNQNVLYLTFPRYLLKIIYESVIRNHKGLTDVNYVSKNKSIEKSKRNITTF